MARVPNAPAMPPTKVYLAYNAVRETAGVVPASIDCSSGKNTLTSPAVGFSVPITPTTSSATNEVNRPNNVPVAIISAEPANSKVRRGTA